MFGVQCLIIEELIGGLSLAKDEDGGMDLRLDEEVLQTQIEKFDLCVGRFLTDRTINFMAMRNRLANIWRPGKGVNIKELGNGYYLFQFYHIVDLKKGCRV